MLNRALQQAKTVAIGGHVKAAGVTMKGTAQDIIASLAKQLSIQM